MYVFVALLKEGHITSKCFMSKQFWEIKSALISGEKFLFAKWGNLNVTLTNEGVSILWQSAFKGIEKFFALKGGV